ncbi:MAG: glutathione S-transferase family protein [Cellvibrionaceae bacterium]|nr:glutathione S-transferase family protein [Cellvibrionaceae bacterium]
MNETMILHHYDNSPYAEKIRLMFGLAEAPWQSLLSPVWPPRPNLDPLAGGYRRIPVAQLGADIFCDSSLIATEVAALCQRPELYIANASAEAKALIAQAEGPTFFAAVGSVPKGRLLGMMLKRFGPLGSYRFIKDRAGLLKGGSSRQAGPEQSQRLMEALFAALEARLQQQQWLDGEQPSLADFSCYHPIWLHLNCSGRPLAAGAEVQRWFEQVTAIGHGQRREIDQAAAFAAARQAEPRPLDESLSSVDEPLLGQAVSIAPADYGTEPVSGTLVGAGAERLILARDSQEFGRLHVHFPRADYQITALD